MKKAQFEQEKNYGAAVSILKTLLSKGLITQREYDKIDTIFKRKYNPPIAGLSGKTP